MRKQIGLLAALFLIAHLVALPPTLEDIDSINFGLGVRDFDVALHQPHPPGYPVFIAISKLLTGGLRVLDIPGWDVRASSLASAIAGAVLIALLFALFRALSGDDRLAWWAMAIAVCSPLFWFTALRPLSDMTGLAFVVAGQVLLVLALRTSAEPAAGSGSYAWGPRSRVTLLLAGAALAGVGAGVRVQAAVLTGPLLLAALLWPGTGFSARDRLLAIAAAGGGVLVWAVPMIAVSGGVSGYLTALSVQAGEDFAGVVMLWTSRQARVAANALLYTFVWPWAGLQIGTGVLAIATAGLLRALWRAPPMTGLLAIAFGPYAVFHLLFQETHTVRYALPLVVPVALLAAYAAAALGRIGLTITAVSILVASLASTLPAARAYARDGSPAFRAFEVVTAGGPSSSTSAAPAEVIGFHAVLRRVEEWERANHHARVLRGAHGREWLALVEHWRREPDVGVRFFADPRRTDLVLFDPHTRSRDRREQWSFAEMPFVAGTRPGATDVYSMRPPGWMLDRGWALTAEIGGVTARDRLGPHIEPAVAWVRARSEPAAVIIGGRNLGGDGDPAAHLTLTAESGRLGEWEARPGYFLWQVQLTAGALAGSGYVPLRVGATAAGGKGSVRVSLEQFDLQSDGTVMIGFGDGWYEPEYNPATGRSWRWISERARLWVRPVGRDVTITIAGESPRQYFDRASEIRALAAGVEVARFTPASDFTQEVVVPAAALAAAGGLVTFESDQWFTPAERGESADPRHLALRIYTVTAR